MLRPELGNRWVTECRQQGIQQFGAHPVPGEDHRYRQRVEGEQGRGVADRHGVAARGKRRRQVQSGERSRLDQRPTGQIERLRTDRISRPVLTHQDRARQAEHRLVWTESRRADARRSGPQPEPPTVFGSPPGEDVSGDPFELKSGRGELVG